MDIQQTLISYMLADIGPILLIYALTLGLSIKTADSAQPRNCSTITKLFSLWEGGVWARDRM